MTSPLLRIAPALLAALLMQGPGLFPGGHEAPGRIPFATLGPDQGLLSGSVVCMAQDADGFLWFGTESGLLRYEGGQSRLWSMKEGLPSAFIQNLLPATGSGLWVSTLRGIVLFRDGRFEAPRLGSGPPRPEPMLIAKDGKGRLWAANHRGIYVQKDGLSFEPLPFQVDGGAQSLSYGPRSGSILLAWKGGIVVFAADGSRRSWGAADGLPTGGPLLVAEDGEGRIWAGSARTLMMKPRDGERFLDRSAAMGRSLSPNGTPFQDRDGSLWLPTQDGALHISGERFEAVDAKAGLPFRWVRTVLRDREDTLWILGPSVARVLGGGRVSTYSLSRGDSGEIVWSILRGRDGRLIVGTDDGAARLGSGGLARIPGTEGRRIKAMAEGPDGTLWLTSTIGPALWLRAGRPKAEPAPFGEWPGGINAVVGDAQGRLWFGHTRSGVLRWDTGAGRVVQDAGPALAQAQFLGAYDLREDAHGRLWAGTTAGLMVRAPDGRWSRFTEQDGLLSHTVTSLALLPDGSAWLAYLEPSGLTRVRLEAGRFQVLEHRTRTKGLRSDAIYALLADPQGRLWVTSDQGLDRLDPPLHVGSHDGMPSEDCALHALVADGDLVWVGTVGGLMRYQPADAAATPPPPRAHLLSIGFGPRHLLPPFGRLAPVPAKEGTAEFRFTAAAYAQERELRFQVRLLGLEESWRDTDSRVARFPVLAGGHYRFEVRSAAASGPFGAAAGLDFEVLPPWWKTWWARALGAGGLAGAVLLFLRGRLAALARSKALLEVEVARRTEELRTRNEELSAALGRVRQLSGLLPICAHCKKIRDDRGYWNQLEQYITEHSEAGFSHGICPDCLPLLFPDYHSQAGAVHPHPE